MKNVPMTRELAFQLWPIIKDWAELKPLQWRFKDRQDYWSDVVGNQLSLNENIEYRVNPVQEKETCEQFNARMQPLKEAYWAMTEAYKKVFPHEP